MKRKKVPDSEKLVAVNLYIEGRASQGQLAEMYGVRKASVQQWIRNYESMGNDAFQQKNRKYSKKLKHQAVQDYLNGKGSQNAICKKYGIRSKSKLQLWIKMYNSGMSFKSNSSGGSAIMDKGRKTTFDERIEIVEYCIAHDRDYKGTASLYDVSYGQVYSWVKKYDAILIVMKPAS